MNDAPDEIMEEYCGDCGCSSDDEVCPRCQAEFADAQRRNGGYRGDRRWNGQVMSRRDADLDPIVLIDARDKP